MHDLAKSYGELMQVVEFSKNLDKLTDVNDDTKEVMFLLFRLHALHRIQLDMGTWLEVEYFNQN